MAEEKVAIIMGSDSDWPVMEACYNTLRELGVSADKAKPMKVVRKVYADVDKSLWPAAKMSVKAQLEYLRDR